MARGELGRPPGASSRDLQRRLRAPAPPATRVTPTPLQDSHDRQHGENRARIDEGGVDAVAVDLFEKQVFFLVKLDGAG